MRWKEKAHLIQSGILPCSEMISLWTLIVYHCYSAPVCSCNIAVRILCSGVGDTAHGMDVQRLVVYPASHGIKGSSVSGIHGSHNRVRSYARSTGRIEDVTRALRALRAVRT